MNYRLTPEEIEQIRKRNELAKQILIKSGRTEKEAEALMDLGRMPAIRPHTNPRILYPNDIFEIPTVQDCGKVIKQFEGYNSHALICKLYDIKNIPIGDVLIYAQFFCREVLDINQKKQCSTTIGMENLACELRKIKDIRSKIRKLCELAGGRKFILESKKQVAPLDKNEMITSVYQFRML